LRNANTSGSQILTPPNGKLWPSWSPASPNQGFLVNSMARSRV